MIGDDRLVAELAATDVRLAETVARRVELVLALRRGDASGAGRGLSDQGLRELQRFVLDLTRREAARAESRRRAGGAGATLPSGVAPLAPVTRPREPADAGRASSA